MDVILALVGLVFAFPIMLIVAILIKSSGRGSVFFAQSRIGLQGETFKCYKFRTMVMDADEQLRLLLERDPEARREWESTQKLKNDPRITPLGRFLRKSSLDELPQLINILRGEMSIVGPRPIVQSEIEKYGPFYPSYAAVRPGLTGLWQVNGRSDTEYDQRVQLDRAYAENWSMRSDMAIVAKTIPALLFSRGAM
ncbi:MAG: sugar transferase [Pseudomonadota bacterium]